MGKTELTEMKRHTASPKLIIPAALALAALGCNHEHTAAELNEEAAANAWMIQDYQKDMVDGAVVRQSTIYPYHFKTNGSQLNELGVRDVETLSRYFTANPGRLSVRRANTEASLYDARVQVVREALASRGVDVARITIEDGHAGGDGATPERVVRILEQDTEKLETVESTRQSEGSSSSSR
jgi:hypothetical protein